MDTSSSLAPKLSLDPSSVWLFNSDNLRDYESSILRGLAQLRNQLRETHKPWSGVQPKDLAHSVDDIDLSEPLYSVDDSLAELQEIYLQHAVYFHHPRYAAHLNCPIAYPALLAELISSAINTSMDTWDQSAGATLIEQKLVDWTIGLIGLGDDADGIFTSGGTQSNLMALLLAREDFCQKTLGGHSVKQQGLPDCAPKMRIFCSEACHFSVQKSAALMGFGYQAVISIPTDNRMRMDMAQLRAQIQRCKTAGELPFAIVATAGTTDFGSIDPLRDLAEIAKAEDIWLHVDAAYGCGLLVSNQQRHKLQGIEQADSVTVDYHKSFLQPVACSAVFAREASHLTAITHHAEYLNPLSAEQAGTPNLVNKSLQTTRRFDALKLWMSLRICGADTIGQAFDRACENALTAYLLLQQDRKFEVIHQPEMSALVFRFNPRSSIHLASEGEQEDGEFYDRLNDDIRQKLLESGDAMVAGTRVNGRRYLKFTFLNPSTTQDDIEQMLHLIRNLGDQLMEERLSACA